ncbi:hypothetical protein GUA87_17630 [Sneathiella sp. P13V-1]|uniref:hypothetical protein n=1 Tax=Sneathiella sp. P13V-1 TaxID=2697366 RepID=UPI00187B19A2|nr:hypothetical protein [Sneathiella sp. P13V-1]MBE7638681.1 hypothetical protein [Sneathiella sp. P13V-1]
MTNLQSIGFLACRLLAVYFLIKYSEILTGIPALLIFAEGKNLLSAPPLLWSIFLITAVLFLWFGAGFIAKKLAPSQVDASTSVSLPLTDALPAIVALIGLVILISTLPDLLVYIVRWAETGWKFTHYSMVKMIVPIFIGIILIKFKHSIARLLKP